VQCGQWGARVFEGNNCVAPTLGLWNGRRR